ncbi:MAG: glycosyltransferase [Snowella sp.]|jgi:glycosyltransferase involved in cell wall biosynthesis|nr:MAG: colanic acid biosynthesis glycosyltransferase WcaL [Snowella sp.]
MKIAYLINSYPMVSLSFIRREIHALESLGLVISRFSIRVWNDELVDKADKDEFKKTKFLLGVGIGGLLRSFLGVILLSPITMFQTLLLTIKIGRRSERGLIIHLIYLAEACVLLQELTKKGISHIHAHFGSNSTTVAMLCHCLGGPTYSFTVHGPEEFDKVNAIALPEKIKRASFVVAVSSFGRSQLLRWCDYSDWSKIEVVHCGLDAMFLAQPYVPLPTEPQFVCVGRLSEQKGISILVEAVGQLAKKGLRFKLVIVGDGSLRPEIETLIKNLQVEEYIQLTGWATNLEVKQHILDSQVMILPSFAEGLPVAIMESLALFRPVLTTYIAGIPELIQPNRSGWLVPAGSVEELAIAMAQILSLPSEKIVEMGKIGAEIVNKQHNATIEAQKLLNLFQSQNHYPSTTDSL